MVRSRSISISSITVAHLILILATSASIQAAPIIVHDGGPTIPISQYLSSFFEGDRDQSPSAGNTIPPQQPQLPMTFPVVTRSMMPGKLTTALQLNFKGWLTSPVFFIGADSFSRTWLATNRDRLARAGATGIVVNVVSLDEFRAMQALAPVLPMAPASVESLASQLGIRVYPVVISTNGLVAQ